MSPEPVVRIVFPAPLNLGPGKIRLLEAIHSAGSLSGAARQLHISYRRAWDMLDSLNRIGPTPLVDSAAGGVKGGGARLTPRGHALLVAYRELEARVMKTVGLEATALRQLLET
jgi:molybdate transport system regulatory protein